RSCSSSSIDTAGRLVQWKREGAGGVELRVAVCGTFDVQNFGDLLFPIVTARRLGDVDLVFVSPVGGPPVWNDTVETLPLPALLADTSPFDGISLGGRTHGASS